MTAETLARAYLAKARLRLKVLDLLLSEKGYSDVVREAQELVELATKAMLRAVGVEPPKWHDVGRILVEEKRRYPEEVGADIERVAAISHELRKERELSFYGDDDFIPTQEYSVEAAQKAITGARFVMQVAERLIR